MVCAGLFGGVDETASRPGFPFWAVDGNANNAGIVGLHAVCMLSGCVSGLVAEYEGGRVSMRCDLSESFVVVVAVLLL